MPSDLNDLKRELLKVFDTLKVVNDHFDHEAKMNAALHMAAEVRPAPLAAAVARALQTLDDTLAKMT
jgi:hypothetical protein